MQENILEKFKFGHLTGNKKDVAMICCNLAYDFNRRIPDSEAKTAGLEMLLEARDLFIKSVSD